MESERGGGMGGRLTETFARCAVRDGCFRERAAWRVFSEETQRREERRRKGRGTIRTEEMWSNSSLVRSSKSFSIWATGTTRDKRSQEQVKKKTGTSWIRRTSFGVLDWNPSGHIEERSEVRVSSTIVCWGHPIRNKKRIQDSQDEREISKKKGERERGYFDADWVWSCDPIRKVSPDRELKSRDMTNNQWETVGEERRRRKREERDLYDGDLISPLHHKVRRVQGNEDLFEKLPLHFPEGRGGAGQLIFCGHSWNDLGEQLDGVSREEGGSRKKRTLRRGFMSKERKDSGELMEPMRRSPIMDRILGLNWEQ
jgi:hypothetical protein